MRGILGVFPGDVWRLMPVAAWRGAGSASGILFVSFLVATSAWAQQPAISGESPAEILNEQQLQLLSAAPGPCEIVTDAGAPRSLQTFVQQDQTNGGSGGGSGCSGAVAPQAMPSGWTLLAGELVGAQLARWGQNAGWHVIWSYSQDWIVPSSVTFQGDFTQAASQVLDDLSSEGALVHGVFYQGNHTLVITGGSQ